MKDKRETSVMESHAETMGKVRKLSDEERKRIRLTTAAEVIAMLMGSDDEEPNKTIA